MQSRLPTLRFAMSTYCRATATRTSVHVKSAAPMHRGCITDLHSKSVTFTQKRGGLSAATSAPQISVGYTIDCLS